MFDYKDLNFDFDGDGILDSHAEVFDSDGDGIEDALSIDYDGDGVADSVLFDLDQDGVLDAAFYDSNGDGIFDYGEVDTNGDGVIDTALMDTDGDGVTDMMLIDYDQDGVPDVTLIDTNGDGIFDTRMTEIDTNSDGVADIFVEEHDYDQDGTFESAREYHDLDHDGVFDEVIKSYDSDGDGLIDTFTTYMDQDGDGRVDGMIQEQFFDRDGDGVIDTYLFQADVDGDNSFDVVNMYDYDASIGELELITIGGAGGYISGTYAEELKQFDPDLVDMDDVSGDPSRAMEEWEFQGETNRCALYSQKFVIEELTGEDIDIEAFADIAEENGWFAEDNGTSLLNMNKMLDHYGIQNEMSFHNGISDIEECLESGGKVIVSIDADEIWYGESDDIFTPGDGANHAVEVIGVDHTDPDNPMVILNDSGSPNGCGEMVPLDDFMDAWEDGDYQMIECIG